MQTAIWWLPQKRREKCERCLCTQLPLIPFGGSTTSQGGMPKNRIQTHFTVWLRLFKRQMERLCTAQSLPAKKITEAKKIQPKTLLAVCVSPRSSGLHLPREKDSSFKPSCRRSCTPDQAAFHNSHESTGQAHPLCLLFP